MTTPIETKVIVSNTNGFRRIPPEDGADRDFTLFIERLGSDNKGNDRFLFVLGGRLFPRGSDIRAVLTVRPNKVFERVQACRTAWMKKVIDLTQVVAGEKGGKKNQTPFQKAWDHSQRNGDWIDEIGQDLATAGESLWFFLFRSSGADAGMQQIGELLAEAALRQELIGSVTSDDLFVPWNLLYTPAANAPFSWSRFWGYQHVVEHRTQDGYLGWLIDGSDDVVASFNFDPRIDQNVEVPCIEPQKSFFERLTRLRLVLRTRKSELQSAVQAVPFTDRIAYFCCHGRTAGSAGQLNLEPAQLALGDDEAITPAEIEEWLDQRSFESNPFVFFNACEAGQMTTVFYESLAAVMLKKKVCALLGSQIDIPTVFAPEYMRRLFERFLGDGDEQTRRLGPLVRELAREFLDKHRNPLGITYSLYRGIDCVVRRGGSNGSSAPPAQ